MSQIAQPMSALAQAVPARLRRDSGETTLATLLAGRQALVTQVEAPGDEAHRLKSLGICAGRRVQLIKAGGPIIIRVLGACVGLSARAAATVHVTPLAE